MESIHNMFRAWAKSPRKPLEDRIAEMRRRDEEREANRPIEDITLGELKLGVFVRDYLLSRDWNGKRLGYREDWDLAPVITYFADGFNASVRFTGEIGCQVYWPEDKRLSEFVPPESGEYFYSPSGLHRAGEWPDRGGRIRRTLCRMHLHHKVVASRAVWKVKQCPHCLAVHQGIVYGYGPSEWVGQVEMTQRWVDEYDHKFPLPGNGWVAYNIDGSVSPDGRSVSFEL
jgi:hypothetical protein